MDRWLPRLAIAGGIGVFLLAGVLTWEVRCENPQRGDVLTQVLGGASEMAAESAFHRADTYFHAGVREESHDHDDHSATVSPNLPLMPLVRSLQKTTVPKEVRHLEGKDARELLPWFHTAVRLDPRYIEAWCVGTYWYYRVGEHGQAEAFISDGIRHNPREYKLYVERGVLFARLGQFKRALSDLEKARELRPQTSEDFEWRAVDVYLRYVKAKLAGDPNVPDLWPDEPRGCPRHH